MKNLNAIDVEENTYKQYYYPLSEDDDITTPMQYATKRPATDSIDKFFEGSKKKKVIKRSSIVGRAIKDGIAYLSTNADDGGTATYLIKMEIYDLKKLVNIDPQQHWKHADVRVKYYCDKTNAHHDHTQSLIYEITKEISESSNCKKFCMNNQ